MNINPSYSINKSNIRRTPSFGSAFDAVSGGLRFLNVNEAIGATLVDFGFMVMPRTIVDSKRGLDAGIETGIRENSGTANHLMIGAIGGMAALAMGGNFNKRYDIASHTIFANNETIDILGNIWHENLKSVDKNLTQNLREKALSKSFYKNAFEGITGLNSADGKVARWVNIKPDDIEKLTNAFAEMSADKSGNLKKIPKEKLNYLKNIIIASTGAEKDFKLTAVGGKSVSFPIASFLDDLFSLERAFSLPKVAKEFEASAADFSANKFIKELKGLKMRSAVLALSISSAIGASVQPLNRWYTKRRTGSDGFVGVANNPNVENKKPEKSLKFAMARVLACAGMVGLALSSISTNFKEIPNKIQFKGKIPTLNHYKLIYGITVASRFLVARSGDELRESCFKDVLGFVNWLILGGFVAKGVATAMDGSNLLNSKAETEKSGFLNWLRNKSLKTVDEVLQSDLAKQGEKTVNDAGKALSFGDLMKRARELNMTSTLKKVRILNLAQLAGYVYSGVVLGYCIPKANIKMTAWFNNKRVNQAQIEEVKQPDVNNKVVVVPAKNISNKGLFSNFIIE